MSEHGVARGDAKNAQPDPVLQRWTAGWHGEPLASSAAAVLGRKQRIMQEVVGAELLSRTTTAERF
ncbi:hypothetical protein [Mycobacterium sp. HNNTM2301]|uniref:hypothetical protein n=1 Tax=Mycobacterium hainanense TaxID=3289775 RepID=UPI0035A6859D